MIYWTTDSTKCCFVIQREKNESAHLYKYPVLFFTPRSPVFTLTCAALWPVRIDFTLTHVLCVTDNMSADYRRCVTHAAGLWYRLRVDGVKKKKKNYNPDTSDRKNSSSETFWWCESELMAWCGAHGRLQTVKMFICPSVMRSLRRRCSGARVWTCSALSSWI